MSILAGLALGAAAAGTTSALGTFGASQQQQYFERNQKRAAAIQQNEELLRARNNVSGLKLAGLSPALASDGKFSPGSAPSSPLGSMNYPSVDLSTSALQLAEAKKSEAEAESIDLDNQNKRDANLTAEYNLKNFFSRLRDDAFADGDTEAAARYDDLSKQVGSVGALKSLHDYFNMADDAYRFDLHAKEYRFSAAVLDEQWKRGIFKDIAQKPRTERRLFAKQIAHLEADIKNLDMSTVKTSHDIQLTDAEIERVKYLARQLNNSDINSMIAEGRYAQAAATIATHWIEDAPETVANAVGVGAKVKTANAIANKAVNAVR